MFWKRRFRRRLKNYQRRDFLVKHLRKIKKITYPFLDMLFTKEKSRNWKVILKNKQNGYDKRK